jgi:hypothetical protein
MKDPTRLTDPRSSSDERLRELLRAAQSEFPKVERMQSLSRRLGEILGATASPGAGAGGGLGISSAIKLGIIAALALGLTTWADFEWTSPYHAHVVPDRIGSRAPLGRTPAPVPGITGNTSTTRAPESARAHTPAPEPASALASAPASELAPALAPAPASELAHFSTLAPAHTNPREASSSPLVEIPGPVFVPDRSTLRYDLPFESEVALLDRATDALRNDPTISLALTSQHKRLFPSGNLVQEREVIAIDALGRLGRWDEARARAEGFLRAFPKSAHSVRVAEMVAPSAGNISDHNR